MRTMLGINTDFESLDIKGFSEVRLPSAISLLDYDAVVVNADYICDKYANEHPEYYRNKLSLTENQSCLIAEEFAVLQDQIVEMLANGKNIYVLVGTNESCYIKTGEKEWSGTGKNARCTNIVTEFDPYAFLPITVSVTHVQGENLACCDKQPYAEYFKRTADYCYYAAYLNEGEGETLLTIKDSSKVVARVSDYGEGKIVFLPMPRTSDFFEDENEWKPGAKECLKALLELDEHLTVSIDDYDLPAWSDSFCVMSESEEHAKLEKLYVRLNKITKDIEKQKQEVKDIRRYKLLVTSSGNQLEMIVKDVLREIGFELMNTERGRSDVIAKYGTANIVAEIKGVTKSAAERHAAQLEKWVSEFIATDGKKPKAILIVNGYCNNPLETRTQEVFPNQMLRYCEDRLHCLMTTTQLLCLLIEIKTNPSCTEARVKELLATVGKYSRYQNVPDYLVPSGNQTIGSRDKGIRKTDRGLQPEPEKNQIR